MYIPRVREKIRLLSDWKCYSANKTFPAGVVIQFDRIIIKGSTSEIKISIPKLINKKEFLEYCTFPFEIEASELMTINFEHYNQEFIEFKAAVSKRIHEEDLIEYGTSLLNQINDSRKLSKEVERVLNQFNQRYSGYYIKEAMDKLNVIFTSELRKFKIEKTLCENI